MISHITCNKIEASRRHGVGVWRQVSWRVENAAHPTCLETRQGPSQAAEDCYMWLNAARKKRRRARNASSCAILQRIVVF